MLFSPILTNVTFKMLQNLEVILRITADAALKLFLVCS